MPDTRTVSARGGDRRNRGLLAAAFATVGFTTLAAQALLLRELLVVWEGSEISLGIALALWLAGTGAGSAIGSVLARGRDPAHAFAWCLVALGALTPPAVAIARLARVLLGVPNGQAAGVGTLLAAAAVAILPLTLSAGLTFTLGVGAARARGAGAGRALSRVYVLEAVGAASASLLLSFVLFPFTEPMSTACVVCAVSALGGAAALAAVPRARPLAAAAALAVAVLASSVGLSGAGADLEQRLASLAWRDAGFVAQRHSVYGLVVAAERGSQKSLYENGVLAASVPDRLAAEEAVHFALLEHPHPRAVLLLGGAAGGAVAEVLKHPSVTRVDCVDLDPALVELGGDAFGDAMVGALRDPRVTVHHTDARFFVKRAAGPYDAVIVNAPDPTTAQLNRLYTVEFFREAAALLAPGGVVAVSVTSSESYIGPELAELLSCVRRAVSGALPCVIAIPGTPCHFIASDSPGSLSRDPVVLASRVAARGLDVVHVRDYYLMDRLSPDRVAYLDERLAAAEAAVNADLSPRAYHLSLLLWTRQFSPGVSSVLAAARAAGTARVAAGAALVVLAVLALSARRARHGGARGAVYAAVAVAGFTEIGIEIAALFSFQSLYGFVYHRVALVTGAFMAGLALGGWLGGRAAERGAGLRTLASLAAALAAAPLILAWVAARVASLPAAAASAGAWLLPLLVVGSAALAGAEFPIAGRLLARDRGAERAGGRLYAADLFGAAAGAVAAGLLLLPAHGIRGTMADLSVLSAAAAVCVAFAAARAVRAPA